MILKYKVPKAERFRFDNKKTIYCKIEQMQKLYTLNEICIYKVKMLNLDNASNIFVNTDLKKLNLIDKIKVKKY